MTDFRDLLPGGASYIEEAEEAVDKEEEVDVSLVTGGTRRLGGGGGDDVVKEGAVVAAGEGVISLLHRGGGGEFLSGRTWTGLEQKLGQTEVVKQPVVGQRGIASGYEGEPEI